MIAAKMIKISQDFEWYFDKGYITQRDGNACIKLDDGKFLVTASGAPKHELGVDDYVIVDPDGKVLAAPYQNKPSIETGAHLAILAISKKNASVHVHSPNTVALAALFGTGSRFSPSDGELVNCFNNGYPELFRYTRVGEIVPFLDPGSRELHESIKESIEIETKQGHNQRFADIIIMKKHGVMAIGDSLDECREHIVRLEHISSILLKTLSASGGNLGAIL